MATATRRKPRSAAQIAASKKNLEKARAARKRNAPRRQAARTDRDISKGEYGNGKVSKSFKPGPGNSKKEEGQWQKFRYGSAKATSVTGNINAHPSGNKTKKGVATTSTGKKITKPVIKRRRRRTTKK